jgi:hypothetical protein
MQLIVFLENDERDMWFQQDGAICHTALASTAFLQEFFRDQLILQGLWSPSSTDFSLPDLFLCAHLKACVYNSNSHSIKEMKTNAEDAVSNINHDTPH